MGSMRYWTHVRLDGAGRLNKHNVQEARVFFNQLFSQIWPDLTSDLTSDPEVPNLLIQRQLVAEIQSANAISAQLAASCLRCFVSHQIAQACADLEQQFGVQGGFTKVDLYPYVLDDVDPTIHQFTYPPLAVEIIRKFDPSQSNLSTWTRRLVHQHKELNRALTESGIYLASDWAILNHTTPAQIRRLLVALTEMEIQRACQILESYHAVYRADRMAQYSTQPTGGSSRRCSAPTSEQLERMVNYLQAQSICCSAAKIQQELWALARALRQIKTGQTISLDAKETGFLRDRPSGDSEPDDADRFLSRYRPATQTCLQQAVTQVIEGRVAYLQSQGGHLAGSLPKSQAFLQAMILFHCEGWSMAEIAPRIGLAKQFQVTRLLELKGLQADIHQIWLMLICCQLPTLLQESLTESQIRPIEQQLAAFLTELNRQLNQPSDKKLKPDQQRDLLRQVYQAFPLVMRLGELIDQALDDYATETYSPNRSQSQIERSNNLVMVCIRLTLASQSCAICA
jgi:hypothetical protein